MGLADALDMLEADEDGAIAPKRARLMQLAAEIERTASRINRNVSLCDDADNVELTALRAKVKAQMAQLKTLPADIFAEIIPSANYETRRFILERFRFMCRLSRNDDGDLLAMMSLQLGGEDHTNL